MALSNIRRLISRLCEVKEGEIALVKTVVYYLLLLMYSSRA